MQTAQIRLETLLPRAVAENWSAETLAESAGTLPATAHRFLSKKRGIIERKIEGKILGLATRYWTVLQERAALDCAALDALNAAQAQGKRVDEKQISLLVKRMLSIISAARVQAPREADTNQPSLAMNSTV